MEIENKVETIFRRIVLIQSKIDLIDEIYNNNPYNTYLLETKEEFQKSINLLEKELEKVLKESNKPVDIDNIKNRVRVVNNDPFLDFKINNSMHKFTKGAFFDENLPHQTVVPENERFPVVE